MYPLIKKRTRWHMIEKTQIQATEETCIYIYLEVKCSRTRCPEI